MHHSTETVFARAGSDSELVDGKTAPAVSHLYVEIISTGRVRQGPRDAASVDIIECPRAVRPAIVKRVAVRIDGDHRCAYGLARPGQPHRRAVAVA